MINIGAYKKGSSKEIDNSINRYPEIISFLKQGTHEKAPKDKSIINLVELMEKR